MKKGFYAILTALTVLALVMTGCPTEPSNPGTVQSGDASLSSVMFDDVTVTLPIATTSTGWTNATDLGDLVSTQFDLEKATDDVVIVATPNNAGARVEVAVTGDETKPNAFAAISDDAVSVFTGGYVIFKVTAANGTVNYYVVEIINSATDTSLDTVKVSDGANESTPKVATIAEALADSFPINLATSKLNTNVDIKLNFGTNFKGTAKAVKVSKTASVADVISALASATPIAFNATNPSTSLAFADQDILIIELTSKDESEVAYYAFQIFIGWDATLKSSGGIVFNGSNVTDVFSAARLGTPVEEETTGTTPTIPDNNKGSIQCTVTQPGTGFTVTATANDDGLSVEVKLSKDGSTWVNNGSAIQFAGDDDDVLYVRVKSNNGEVTYYYKLAVWSLRTVDIPFGTVTSFDLDSLDSAWDDATDWLPINRINTTETQAINRFDVKDQTFGRAKLLWDEDGLYIYAQVWEKNITEATSSDFHTVSSVELFINESTNRTGTVASGANTNGGQYRLGANNVRSGAPSAQITAFTNANSTYGSAAKKYLTSLPSLFDDTRETNVTTGYAVMFQAPWLFKDRYGLKHNKPLSIELQINATNPEDANGGRVGVLNWNSANSNSYNSLALFGEATLNLGSHSLSLQQPAIITQPAGAKIATNASMPELTVVIDTDINPSDTATYQWYKATKDSNTGGTPISDATSASYTPTDSTTAVGKFFYYVVVSVTRGGATKSTPSAVAKILIYDPDAPPADIELVDSSNSFWDATAGGLVLTSINGWNNYNGITNLTIDSADIEEYGTVEIVWLGYLADGSLGTVNSSIYNPDLYIGLYGEGGGGNVYNALSYGTSGSDWVVTYDINASYPDEGAVYDADFSDGGALVINAKNETNTAPNRLVKLVIKSVKLKLKP